MSFTTDDLVRQLEATGARWRTYSNTYEPKPAMPAPPAPRNNPHRHDDYAEASRVGPANHLTLADVIAVAVARGRDGYAEGYRERDVVARTQIASAYDEGWRAGMEEQHGSAEPAVHEVTIKIRPGATSDDVRAEVERAFARVAQDPQDGPESTA